jgi:hypothetical protein
MESTELMCYSTVRTGYSTEVGNGIEFWCIGAGGISIRPRKHSISHTFRLNPNMLVIQYAPD